MSRFFDLGGVSNLWWIPIAILFSVGLFGVWQETHRWPR